MTHYQKNAAIAFRVIAVVALIAAVIFIIAGLIFILPATNPAIVILVSLPYFIGGAILFALSKFLAKLVCIGLEKSDEN